MTQLPPNNLWEYARVTALAPLLASWFESDVSRIPDEIRADVVTHTMLNLRSIAELDRLRRMLDAADLRWFVAKGPVLGEVIYRRGGTRLYGDLDVFIHPDDFEAALTLIEASGAVLLDRNWQHIRGTSQSELSLQLEHGTLLDLHWHPITDRRVRGEIGLDVTNWFERLQSVEIMGVPYPTLDPLDTLVYACLHAVLSGGHTLRWLVDIAECLAWAQPDPIALQRRSRELGCELAVQVMLARVASGLDPRATRAIAGRRRLWTRLAAVVDRLVPLDPSVDTYSGRAFFGSTRRDTRSSVVASVLALSRARSAGPQRRKGVVTATELRRVAGTEVDRRAWLDLVRSHGTRQDVTTVRTRVGTA